VPPEIPVQNETLAGTERQQTDDSLRTEREKVDETFGEELSAIDEMADAVISRARCRADEVLAKARARTDRESATTGLRGPSSEDLASKRGIEDRALRQERADADETLRVERAEHFLIHAIERAETDKDLLRERARTDDALAMRDEFLGIVSHELRNQLNAMTLLATLIAQHVLREDHVDQVLLYAQRSQRVGARMNRLIGDLVDVASIEAGVLAVRRELVDATPIVVEAVTTFQEPALNGQLSLTSEVIQPLPLAAMDGARILQVLINLLSNAFKFTPPGGKVAVRVESAGEEMRFTVSDSGVGIPAAKLDAVFERRVQVSSDRRGLGLGLYISRSIVQGHGGRIWVESTMGEGSTFCFTIPIAACS
jgi:signal transduction histidine kinase